MKEYRLKSWPELPAEFRRTACRRLLNDLSQRHMTEPELRHSSGSTMQEIRALIRHLASQDLLDVRDAPPPLASRAGFWRWALPLPAWIRRAP